jgi:hypothetical protein
MVSYEDAVISALRRERNNMKTHIQESLIVVI